MKAAATKMTAVRTYPTHMPAHTSAHMSAHMSVHVPPCLHAVCQVAKFVLYPGAGTFACMLCPPLAKVRCMGMFVDVQVDLSVDLCADMGVHMSVHMCIDMCMDT